MPDGRTDAAEVVARFVECINRRDVEGLGRLMTDDHTLQVFDEPPLVGREANLEAWGGYAASFPEYVIHAHAFAHADGCVAVVGHTTGSHLGLTDEDERALTIIWVATVAHGRLSRWRLLDDTPEHRADLGLPQQG
jgi:ketosteroid isomerase-like protein